MVVVVVSWYKTGKQSAVAIRRALLISYGHSGSGRHHSGGASEGRPVGAAPPFVVVAVSCYKTGK